jgi:glycosyltransferase involved in cell wall biosynthesis
MNILFCVEFYYPSLGGAQEVVRQLAERFAEQGHSVTVATSFITSRQSDEHNRVRIVEFNVSGNRVRGFQGESDRYQAYLANAQFDIILFYAAQQWTFDAAWPVMQLIRARKVLVPCGYSGLFEPAYKDYFEEIKTILLMMDSIIYHASDYRDVQFGRRLGLRTEIFIPNAADETEFSVALDPEFHFKLSIPESAKVLLTVGTMTGTKGHLELVQAFQLADFHEKETVLILNGNMPEFSGKKGDTLSLLGWLAKERGWFYAAKHGLKMFLQFLGFEIGKASSIYDWARRINKNKTNRKHVIVVDLPRDQLVQAYLQSDLFVFASNIEYSPLVLFEACAAGLPFLSVPAGNAEEIAIWTGGGEICSAQYDEKGYTRVAPEALAKRIEELLNKPELLAKLGNNGKDAFLSRFNWGSIHSEYNNLFVRLISQDTTGVSAE